MTTRNKLNREGAEYSASCFCRRMLSIGIKYSVAGCCAVLSVAIRDGQMDGTIQHGSI